MSWFKSNLEFSAGPLRSARSYYPGDDGVDSGTRMMIDLALSDVQKAITDFEKRKEEERQNELKKTSQPDYSWLMDWKHKVKKTLSFKECSDIETQCQKLKPCEWKDCINAWRERLPTCSTRDEIVESFMDIVVTTVNTRINRELQMIREADTPPQRMTPPEYSRSVSELSVLSLRFPGIALSSPNIRDFNEPSDIV
uniref:CPG4 domain-containing protein n=1 Tax=Panagrellus redivivus TaxID=6233 RepID=A0A7E4W383_PANRE